MENRWLEVRTAISPSDSFFNRVRFMALSVRSMSGKYADAITRVAVGSDEEPYDLDRHLPWSRELGIEWYWVDREEFSSWKNSGNQYAATIIHRFRPPFAAQNVLVLDPDAIALKPFDELFALVSEKPCVAGVMAHKSPWRGSPFKTPSSQDHYLAWKILFNKLELDAPQFIHELSGWGIVEDDPGRRLSPVYLNSGAIFAPGFVFARLWQSYLDAADAVRDILHTYFHDQLAFTLALMKERISYRLLPLRFNFPNDPLFEQAYPKDAEDIRILHFLRRKVIDRDAIFRNFDSIREFVAKTGLTGSNEAFRSRIERLLPLAQ